MNECDNTDFGHDDCEVCPAAPLEAHQYARQLALQALADALTNFVACSCLYYHSHSLNEFAKPIKQARAALAQARPFLGPPA